MTHFFTICRTFLAFVLVFTLAFFQMPVTHAIIIYGGSPPDETTNVSNSDTFILDNDNSATDVTLQFGSTLNESLKWNSATSAFDLSDDLNLEGGLSTTAGGDLSGGTVNLNNNSNNPVNIGTGTSTGTVSVGGGSNSVSIDSDTWDISAVGVASGLTGLSSSGSVNFSAASSFLPPSGAADPGTCSVGEVFYNTTSNALKVCTASNSWTIAVSPNGADLLDGVDASQFLRSDTSDTFTSGTLTTDNGTTLAVAGSANIGDGGDDVFINSDDWDISSAGLASGFTGLTTSGTLSSTGSLEVSGNANIGDGGDDVFINSDDWDISSAGVASGFTGLTSTGTVNLSGSGSMRIREVADEAAAACTTVNEIVLDTTESRIYICTATGTPGTWTTPSDFEDVYGTDSDSILSTSNGTFTISTGTGDFIVDSNDWNVTAAGALDAATVTSNGLLTGSAGATISGATTNINSSSNFATNINTGTSTGQVSVGGNSNCVTVDSNTWDISCAGILSGLTGLSSSGSINFSTANSLRIPEAASDPATCTPGQRYFNTTTNTERICVGTNVWSSSGAAGTQYVFAYDTTTQTVAVANVYQDITFNTNGDVDGWAHTAGSANFTAAVGGVYMANVSARVAKSGGANTSISIRGAKNGLEIPGSQIGGTASGSSGDGAGTNFIFSVVAGDVITIQMTGGTPNVQIVPTGTGVVVPSISLSIWRMK